VPSFPKTPAVRLKGTEMAQLRLACLQRDRGRCCECHALVSDSLPDWHPLKFHMAHLKSRGANGADELSNVRCLCGSCHRAEHQGRVPRPI